MRRGEERDRFAAAFAAAGALQCGFCTPGTVMRTKALLDEGPALTRERAARHLHQERRPEDMPIYIGASGTQMIELAGEIADGALLDYLTRPAYNARAVEALDRGAQRAGRSWTPWTGPSWWGHPVPRPAALTSWRRRGCRPRCWATSAPC